MGCDMVVALGRATVDGSTLFGHNTALPDGEFPTLVLTAGREYSPGERVQAQYVQLPQVRQTNTVLGSRAPHAWGYQHGVNEHGVAAGCTLYHHKLQRDQAGLTGADLVRLLLERCRSAAHGVEILAELLERHGQGAFTGCAPSDGDHAFLLADAREAYLIETAAQHWVLQQILEVRAVSNISTIRQDWNRISPGLGQHAISQGWWPGDGTKVDFADALGVYPTGEASALRRWGRATLLLEQQNGHIDVAFFRRLLGDHYEGTHFEVDPYAPWDGPLTLCQHQQAGCSTAASLAARLSPEGGGLHVIDLALGPPCQSVYFPLVLQGDPPTAICRESTDSATLRGRLARLFRQMPGNPELARHVREYFAQLQARFDQSVEDWAAEFRDLNACGDGSLLRQRAATFMERNLGALEETLAALTPRPTSRVRLSAR